MFTGRNVGAYVLVINSTLMATACKNRAYNQKTDQRSDLRSSQPVGGQTLNLSNFLSNYCEKAADEKKNCSLSPFNIWTTLQATGPALSSGQRPAYDTMFPPTLVKELETTWADIKNAESSNGFSISALRTLWVQSGLELSAQAKLLSGVKSINFKEPFTKIINEFVEEHTDPVISDLLPNALDSVDTGFVLTGVLSLKDAWFHEPQMMELSFDSVTGNSKKVPYLSFDAHVRGMVGSDGSRMAMTYTKSGEVFVTFVQYADANAPLNISELNTFGKKFNSLSKSVGKLLVPSFKIEMKKSFDVITELQKTPWLAPLFAGDLNLYKDSSKNNKLHISSILHKTFLALNEKGIEASAATAVAATRGEARAGKDDIYFDHPFYFIVHSGRMDEFGFSPSTILFMGKVNEL